MLVVAGTARMKPGLFEEALPVLHTMEKATNDEAGCISYHFYVDPADETLIFVFEEWEDKAALEAHMESDHMATFRDELQRLLTESPQIKRYVVPEPPE